MALTVAGLLAACGGSNDTAATATTTTTTTTIATTTTLSAEQVAAAEFAADKKLIVALWRGESDAFGGGRTQDEIDAGFQYTIDHSYPGTDYSVDTCKRYAFGSQRVSSYTEEIIVKQETIERDDGWAVPGGPLKGVVPDGRIYIMSVHATYTLNNNPQVVDAELHATIVNGAAYQFPDCG